MSLSRNGFQTFVNQQPAPAVVGDFASMNPRSVALAGPGAFRADLALPVIVGNFAWGVQSTSLAYGSSVNGGVLGFVANELQTVITDFLGQDRLTVQAGFPVTLYTHGDFWAAVQGGAVNVGDTIYADRDLGTPTVTATAATFTASITTTVLTVTAVATGALRVGDVIAGAGVTVGTTITSLGTGTGGTGTYNLSASQTVGSEAMTVAATDSGYKAATPLAVAPTAVSCSLAAGTGVLTVGAVTGPPIQIGASVSGTGVPANLFITAQLTGTPGQTGTYKVNTIGPAVSSFTGTFAVGSLVKITRTF